MPSRYRLNAAARALLLDLHTSKPRTIRAEAVTRGTWRALDRAGLIKSICASRRVEYADVGGLPSAHLVFDVALTAKGHARARALTPGTVEYERTRRPPRAGRRAPSLGPPALEVARALHGWWSVAFLAPALRAALDIACVRGITYDAGRFESLWAEGKRLWAEGKRRAARDAARQGRADAIGRAWFRAYDERRRGVEGLMRGETLRACGGHGFGVLVPRIAYERLRNTCFGYEPSVFARASLSALERAWLAGTIAYHERVLPRAP